MSDKKIFVFVQAVFDLSGKSLDNGFYCCVDDVQAFRMTEYEGHPAVMFQLRNGSARYVTNDLEPFDAMLRGKWQDWTEWAEVHTERR